MKSSSLSSLTNSLLTRDQAFFRGNGKKERRPFPLASKKKRVEGPPDRRLILTSTTPLLPSIIIERRPLKPVPADSSF